MTSIIRYIASNHVLGWGIVIGAGIIAFAVIGIISNNSLTAERHKR